MHQLACLEEDPLLDMDERPTCTVVDNEANEEWDTYASEGFCSSPNWSVEFRSLVCQCLAVEPEDRLLLGQVLQACERNVRRTQWRRLVDEVSEIFDDPN